MGKRKRAYRKVLKEFQNYKRKVMYRMSRNEIWNACGKIHFYSCIKEYFELNDRISQAYLELVLAEPSPVRMLWETYLQEESLRYQTWDEIDELLENVLLKWRAPMAG